MDGGDHVVRDGGAAEHRAPRRALWVQQELHLLGKFAQAGVELVHRQHLELRQVQALAAHAGRQVLRGAHQNLHAVQLAKGGRTNHVALGEHPEDVDALGPGVGEHVVGVAGLVFPSGADVSAKQLEGGEADLRAKLKVGHHHHCLHRGRLVDGCLRRNAGLQPSVVAALVDPVLQLLQLQNLVDVVAVKVRVVQRAQQRDEERERLPGAGLRHHQRILALAQHLAHRALLDVQRHDVVQLPQPLPQPLGRAEPLP
mmetsp:Transcript_9106/g.23294  ORF Transcript_9106/g.23294 Transcript_9106/m.23294 type:complete len:256 (+) Transcript_9106:1112-1879(+)